MLRESSATDESIAALNIAGTVDLSADSGVPHGALLSAFTNAAVQRSDDLPQLRREVADTLGVQAMVDACGVVANFQRMVRIADGCGIPLDDFTKRASDEWREDLGLHEFASAANTPIAAGTGASS